MSFLPFSPDCSQITPSVSGPDFRKFSCWIIRVSRGAWGLARCPMCVPEENGWWVAQVPPDHSGSPSSEPVRGRHLHGARPPGGGGQVRTQRLLHRLWRYVSDLWVLPDTGQVGLRSEGKGRGSLPHNLVVHPKLWWHRGVHGPVMTAHCVVVCIMSPVASFFLSSLAQILQAPYLVCSQAFVLSTGTLCGFRLHKGERGALSLCPGIDPQASVKMPTGNLGLNSPLGEG